MIIIYPEGDFFMETDNRYRIIFEAGQVVDASYRIISRDLYIPIKMRVQAFMQDQRLVLSYGRRRTVIATPEDIIHGAIIGRFAFKPMFPQDESPED